MTLDRLAAQFREKAEAVSARVATAASMAEALDYAVEICTRKEACQLLVAGCGEPLSPPAEALCGLKGQSKLLAAPGLPAELHGALAERCRSREIALVDRGLRAHLAGVDIGLTIADWGIAETGTLVIDARDEDLRLATMVSEIHVALLPRDRIRASALELAPELGAALGAAPQYLTFVTGASRTADIERVLALGVHGPLELHIVLI
jgi:L-lactate dehydrogenase complex protein LldG